ncbi:VOC family protein [Rummeliibacillus pycnus]|uniref:VOC family protein n=1 Tax=Rummeliibacillus pycnus TaxID=101070 RepID=UPI0037C53BB3
MIEKIEEFLPQYTIDAETSVARVVLRVVDLTRQIAFYEQVVGLTVLNKTEDYAYLGAKDDTKVLLELRKTAKKLQPAKSTGLFHIAFLVPSREAFATKFFEILRNKNTVDSPLEQANRFPHFERIIPIAKLDSASDHGYSEAFYLSDVEGNGIEIYADRPKEEWDQYPAGSNPLNIKELVELAQFDTDGKLPQGTTVGHVHLRIDDIEKTLAFYNQALGFESQLILNDAFFISAGGYHHHIAGNTWSGSNVAHPLDIHSGLQEVQFKLPTKDAYEKMKDHVKQWTPLQELESKFVVIDPSGNRLAFLKGIQ